MPEVQAVLRYLKQGVEGVKRPGDALYDRADALVAALGALPHVAQGFREVPCLAVAARMKAASLKWALGEEWDEDRLQRILFPPGQTPSNKIGLIAHLDQNPS